MLESPLNTVADLSTRPLILVVDDNEPTATALAALLKRRNYRSQTAFRGSEAIELARENGAAISAAVVDIHLPDISGLVVSQTLRELLGPKVPIVVLSGDTSMATLNSLPHVGATYFFSKPVNPGHLLDRLQGWLQPSDSVVQAGG